MLNAKDVKKTAMFVAGIPQHKIAKEFGVSQQAISHFANKEEIQIYIQEAQTAIAKHIPKAVKNITNLVDKFEQIDSIKDPKLKDLGYKASEKVLKITGIEESHTTNNYFNQFNQQNTNIISPEALAMINAIDTGPGEGPG